MKPLIRKSLRIISFLFSIELILTANLPIVVFHGINDNCQGWMQELTNNFGRRLDVYSKCVETGADKMSVFTSIKAQAIKACEEIRSDLNLQKEFTVIAVSQGNMIGRYILQACQMQAQVRKYISIGGPHMGVGQIPKCQEGFLCNLLLRMTKSLVYFRLVQNFISPAGYFKDFNNYANYLKYSSFLPDLNNEKLVKNEEYKSRFMGLNKLVLIKFLQDEMIFPQESEWFEFYEEKSGVVKPLLESDFYKEDYLGLKHLNENGKVFFYTINAMHVKFTWEDMEKLVIPHLKD